MKKEVKQIVLISLAAVGVGFIATKSYYHQRALCYQKIEKEMISGYRKFESGVVAHVPIFEDYLTGKKSSELRQYLLNDHLSVARKKGSEVKNQEEIAELVSAGTLVPISGDDPVSTLYYFYNVPKELRYLTPDGAAGLRLLTERFQQKVSDKIGSAMEFATVDGEEDLPAGKIPADNGVKVKLAVSSVLRPGEYQKSLRNKNSNASSESTHSYGVSVDIFYDDYYVMVPEREVDSIYSQGYDKMRSTMGFMLGDALRRQLQSILHETLIELQSEKLIYAIIEKTQRCYHITFL